MGYNRPAVPDPSKAGSLALSYGGSITGALSPYSLLAGRSYALQLTIACQVNLPDPPNDMATVELWDIDQNSATFPVTVNGGSKNLQDSGLATTLIATNGMKVQFTFVSDENIWITRLLA